MIYEYAFDPELLATWGKDKNDFRYFKDKFGLGQARMMSEYPGDRKWRKKFRQSWDEAGDDGERKRIEELFARLTERKVKRNWGEYDGNSLWLENAEREHNRSSDLRSACDRIVSICGSPAIRDRLAELSEQEAPPAGRISGPAVETGPRTGTR